MTKPRIAAACAFFAVFALIVSACSSSTTSGAGSNSSSSSGSSSTGSSAPSSSSSSSAPKTMVHIRTLNSDGAMYGVGMPVILFFSRTIKSGKALQDAIKVTANGQPLKGGLYFETSTYYKGYPIEAHWRPQNYWPANSQVHVDIPAKGLSGGGNFAFDDSLTLDYNIGAQHLLTVDDATHKLTVMNGGKLWGTFPVSLGASNTPTRSGIKVIMEKGRDISMKGPGYFDPHVKYTQRLTYGGEYLHSAPWNVYNITHGIDSSNGCTNMLPADAIKLYGFLEVGDVVQYPNANGGRMQIGEGYGDWNVTWGQWQTGGLIPTTR